MKIVEDVTKGFFYSELPVPQELVDNITDADLADIYQKLHYLLMNELALHGISEPEYTLNFSNIQLIYTEHSSFTSSYFKTPSYILKVRVVKNAN